MYVIGVDVGGTNTDAVVLLGKTVVAAAKRPTEENKTKGIVNAIRAALENVEESGTLSREYVVKNVSRVCIGTTHFVNAVVARDESRLARVAVVRLCGSASRSLGPFCDFPGDLREILCGSVHLVSGGFEFNLKPVAELDEDELKRVAREISQCDPPVRNVVVSGVFSPHDSPSCNQEQRAAEIIQTECPGITYTLSHKIGLLGLLERENAAIMNEALKPLAQRTVRAFRTALDDLGLKCAFYLTQNDGTLISAEEAVQYPVFTFSSGPTNSMRGAAYLSKLNDAIVIDVGGTTTDVGVLKNGFPREASSQCKVGGVRTNFSMPDVLSLELGGGSTCLWDDTTRQLKLGHSVGHRLTSEALCFGGNKCTTTDVAVAAGVAPYNICQVPGALDTLHPMMVYRAMSHIREMVENAIDCVKTEKADVPVVLVGGGSCLLDRSVGLQGASTLITPNKYWDVANAIGAALGTVGAMVDSIESLDLGEPREGEGEKETEERVKKARLGILEAARERAISEAIRKGAKRSEVYIHTEEVVDIAYVAGTVRVRVKAIGPLHDTPVDEREVESLVPDNPHWPYASIEDKESDEAAGLPPPTVNGGEWTLSDADIECVAVGAGLLGCGGGGDPNTGRLLALQQLARGKTITVVNPLRLKASEVGLLTCAAFMGAPTIIFEKLVAGSETQLALEALERVLASGLYTGEGEEGRKGNERVRVTEKELGKGKKVWIANTADINKIDVSNPAEIEQSKRITHLICAEIGGFNALEPLVLGAERGLPVLDADGMGRAFPELQMYTPLIYGCKPYPSAVADNKGEMIVCTHVTDATRLEDFFRGECVRMGMSCAVTIGVLTLQDVLRTAILFSTSMAWQLGRAVKRSQVTHSNVLEAITKQQSGQVLLVGKVTDVVRVTEGGFGCLEAVVEGLDTYRGYKVRVLAKNENYLVRRMRSHSGDGGEADSEGVVVACTPDLICIVDSETGYPITTESVRYGLRVGVLALPANPRLLTPQAMEVVGPAAFGIDESYQPPVPFERRAQF